MRRNFTLNKRTGTVTSNRRLHKETVKMLMRRLETLVLSYQFSLRSGRATKADKVRMLNAIAKKYDSLVNEVNKARLG